LFVTRPETLGDTEQIHPLTGLPITSTDTPPTLQWNPGIVQELAPGEDVKFSTPPTVDSGYADFMRQQLRAICVASGVPYEVLTGDMGTVNDRTARVILNKFKRAIQMWQFNIVADKFLQPIWNAWIERGWLTGTLDLPGYEKNPRQYQSVKWMPQRSQYINPVQDVQADKDAIRAGFTTRSSVVSEYGEDAEQIDTETGDRQRARR
jgi:lambda family phage portal protein